MKERGWYDDNKWYGLITFALTSSLLLSIIFFVKKMKGR